MNGAHDMGGIHGFGPVVPEADEPTFHAEWEGRVFALALAAGRAGQWNIDMVRFARENRPPADYLAKSYYEIWLAGLEAMLAERGLVSAEEIDAGRPLGEPKKVDGLLQHGAVEAAFSRGRRRAFQRAFVSATAFGRRTFIRQRTHGCPGTCEAAPAQSSGYVAATSSRIQMPSGRARIRNGSTLCGLTRATSGATKQINCLRYRWTHGSPIWSLPTKLLDGTLVCHLCRLLKARRRGRFPRIDRDAGCFVSGLRAATRHYQHRNQVRQYHAL